MTDEGAGSTSDTTQAGPATTDTGGGAQDAMLRAARDEAAKNRIKAREASEALDGVKIELASMQAQQAAILKAAGLDAGTSEHGPDLKAIEDRAKGQTDMAKNALRRADFAAKALKAGIDPGLVDDAYELAATRGYLDSVDVDLSTAQVAGTEDAVSKFVEEKPVFMAPNRPTTPTDSRPPGSAAGPGIDLKNAQVGDIAKMSWEEFAAAAKDGIVVHDRQRGTSRTFNLGGDKSTKDIDGARAAYNEWFKPQ